MVISSPIITLPNLYAILKPFSIISGLKINHDKSQAMNISLEKTMISTLKQPYKFIWKIDTLPYLGKNLTPSWKTLHSQNYPALFKNIGADLTRWSLHPPSWFGRLLSVEMNMLPRILYLFRTLPVALAKLDLKSFQTKLLSFIWGNKRPRVNIRTLYAPREKAD